MLRILITLCLLAVANSGFATNMAVIDLDKILKNYSLVQQIDAKLHKQFASQGKAIQTQQKEIEKKLDELKRNSSIMTSVQRGDLQTEITTDKNNLELQQSRFNQDLQAAQSQAMQTVLDKINQAVIAVAKQHKYQVVLQKSKTIYIDSAIDISNEVLAKLQGGDKKPLKGLAAKLNNES